MKQQITKAPQVKLNLGEEGEDYKGGTEAQLWRQSARLQPYTKSFFISSSITWKQKHSKAK